MLFPSGFCCLYVRLGTFWETVGVAWAPCGQHRILGVTVDVSVSSGTLSVSEVVCGPVASLPEWHQGRAPHTGLPTEQTLRAWGSPSETGPVPRWGARVPCSWQEGLALTLLLTRGTAGARLCVSVSPVLGSGRCSLEGVVPPIRGSLASVTQCYRDCVNHESHPHAHIPTQRQGTRDTQTFPAFPGIVALLAVQTLQAEGH